MESYADEKKISGVMGVYWCKSRDTWFAQIDVKKRTSHLGYFDDFSEAVAHRYAAEQCLDEKHYSNSTAKRYLTNLLKKQRGRK